MEAFEWRRIIPSREGSGALYQVAIPNKTLYIAAGAIPNELEAVLNPNEPLSHLPFSPTGWLAMATQEVDYGILNGWASFAEKKTDLPGIHSAYFDLKIRGWTAYRPHILLMALQQCHRMGLWMKIHNLRLPDDEILNTLTIALFRMRFKGTTPLGLVAQNVDNLLRTRGEVKRRGQWLGENETEPLLREELLSDSDKLCRAIGDAYAHYRSIWRNQGYHIRNLISAGLQSDSPHILIMIPQNQIGVLRSGFTAAEAPLVHWKGNMSGFNRFLDLQRRIDARQPQVPATAP